MITVLGYFKHQSLPKLVICHVQTTLVSIISFVKLFSVTTTMTSTVATTTMTSTVATTMTAPTVSTVSSATTCVMTTVPEYAVTAIAMMTATTGA